MNPRLFRCPVAPVAGLPVAGAVVAERLPEVVAGMPWRHPLLRALALSEVGEAADHDVTAAGILRWTAVAWLPGHLRHPWPPRVPEPALFRYNGET